MNTECLKYKSSLRANSPLFTEKELCYVHSLFAKQSLIWTLLFGVSQPSEQTRQVVLEWCSDYLVNSSRFATGNGSTRTELFPVDLVSNTGPGTENQIPRWNEGWSSTFNTTYIFRSFFWTGGRYLVHGDTRYGSLICPYPLPFIVCVCVTLSRRTQYQYIGLECQYFGTSRPFLL